MTILLITSLIANVGFIVCIVMMLKLFRKVKDRLSCSGLANIPLQSLASGAKLTPDQNVDLNVISTELLKFADQFTTTTKPDQQD